MTRCKFKVESVTTMEHGASVELYPVHSGSPENEKFYQYTPGGKLSLQVLSPETAKQFIPGKEYYIDISSVNELQTVSKIKIGSLGDKYGIKEG